MDVRLVRFPGVIAVSLLNASLLFAATPTTTTLTTNPSPTAHLGNSVTLKATVAPTATGNVTFYDGATVLGVAPLSASKATFMTSTLGSGTHSLTARYDGNGTTSPSVSNAASLTVNANNANTLLPEAGYSAGFWPEAIVIGDFNNDQKQDLAVANFGGGTVTIFLGNGTGTFSKLPDAVVLAQARSIAVGDFDGDGNADLAIAEMSGKVSILLGNGNGTFKTHVDYNACSVPYYVAVGDFNNDGIADLAVVDNNVGFDILIGKGDGTFKPAVAHTGVFPSSVAVADFNHDGKADLVFANPTKGNVSVVLGNGDGTFQAPIHHAAGARPFGIAVGDFDENGNPDVVLTDYSGELDVLTGVGNGMLNNLSHYPVGDVPTTVAVGDLDGDGHQDLIVTNSYSNTLSVLLGDGTGSFKKVAGYIGSGLPVAVAVGEFNGDKVSDIAYADFYRIVGIFVGAEYELTVTPTSGAGQSAKVGTNFTKPVVATVTHGGVPAAGVAVLFLAPNNGASANFPDGENSMVVYTDASGKATLPFTANATAGNYKITARVGFNSSATFAETNTP